MRKIDKSAAELGSVPSIVLMENAAMSCVLEIVKDNDIKSAAIFAGKGNNGGDGFAIARHLTNRGINVEVFLVCGSDFTGDALVNFEIISKMGIKITELGDTDFLDLKLKTFDITIDAIFGTGIRGRIEGLAFDIINIINEYSNKILSVDIPSGINADTGEICGTCIKADMTVTFVAYKRGLLLYPGAEFAGNVTVSDISIPEYIIDSQNINTNIIDRELVRKIFPKRKENSHKGNYGKVLIIGGSRGLTGAAVMAAKACEKSGAGLVTVGVPESLNSIFETKLTEPMTLPLADKNGELSKECVDTIAQKLNDFDVCLFGPGIGRGEDIKHILEEILKISKIPIIIDADGLYSLSQKPDMLNSCGCSLILTPHEMEMARLVGADIEYVKNNRFEISADFAGKYGVSLILKGHHTIVTSPDGSQYININGNSGMATGGSGDVLSGMCAAYTTRTTSETDAGVIGVFIHGLSGDICKEKLGADALLPTDIIENISNAVNKLGLP